MKRRNHCSVKSASSECHSAVASQSIQPFPETGLLADHSNLPLAILADRIREARGRTYTYVVSTVKQNAKTLRFEQSGSAPNFQGDVLTLCTCKHQMRSRLSADQWQSDVWIAGFTSRTIYGGRHWLFYLAKVGSAHASHSDVWKSMESNARNAKAAHIHFLGDIFKPKYPQPTGTARYSPSRYLMPSVHAHRRSRGDRAWHNDIKYYLASKSRHPPLLVADPKLTFLWKEPLLFFAGKHCRDYFTWPSVQELIARLREES